MKFHSFIVSLGLCSVLAACGGGGSSGDGPSEGPPSDVAVAFTAPTGAVGSGGPATLSLNVSNTGAAAASNVVVATTLGSGLSMGNVSCTASGGATCPSTAGGTSINVPSLPAQGALAFAVTVNIASGLSGDIQSSVSATSSHDAAASNNTSSAILHVYTADISVAGVGPALPVAAGAVASYVFTVSNAGPDTAALLNVAAVPDSNATLGAISCASAGGATCPAALGAVMTVTALPKNGTLTFTVPATVAAAASTDVGITLNAQMQGDPINTNNTAGANASIIAPNSVRLQSDGGDYIGGGRSYAYTQANAKLSISAFGGVMSVAVNGNEDWNGNFNLPSSVTTLVPGTYNNLTRAAFSNPAIGGVDWNGEGRGCNTLIGSVTINTATYVAGELKVLDFSFTQHCEGAAPALHGQVHWSVYDTTTPPGPVVPIPAGLWDAPAGATPSSGNYVYLSSDLGDYIGGGQKLLYTPTNGNTISISANGLLAHVDVGGWDAQFMGMTSITQLQAGYYAGVQRYPFHNPVAGGMNWSGNGRGCNTLSGWFAIDSISYTGGSITALDLRFEQHCEGGTTALRGKIHWIAP